MMTLTAIGRATRDLELRTNDKGTSFVGFDLAVDIGFGDRQTTNFVNCIAFNGLATRLINAKVGKGTLLQVTGRAEENHYTKKDGTPGFSIRLTISDWSFIPTNNRRDEGQTASENKNMSEHTPSVHKDDDLPF